MLKTDKMQLRAYFAYGIAAIFLCYEMALQTSPSIMIDYLMRDLNINAAQLGLMAGCYFYSYTLMQIPAGLLFDRFNARTLIAIAILICVSGAFFFGWSENVWMAALGRFLMGIGSAFAFIGVLVVATQGFPLRYFAFLVGIAQLLAALGALGGEAPLAALLHHFGWRETINHLAISGIIIAVLVYCIIPAQPISSVPRKNEINVWQSLKYIFKSTQTWWVGLHAFCTWAPVTVFAALWGVPFFMKLYNINNTAAATAIAMIWIGLGIASPLLGWFSDKLGRRRILLSSCSLLGLFSSALIIYWHHLPLSLTYFLLFCFGIATAGQILSFAVVRDNNRPQLVATAIGFNNMAVVAGGAVFQPLAGYILQSHWDGLVANGIPVYSVGDYTAALSLVPLSFLVALIVSRFFIRETYCKPKYLI